MEKQKDIKNELGWITVCSFNKLDHLLMDLFFGSDHIFEGFNIQISMNDSLKTVMGYKY